MKVDCYYACEIDHEAICVSKVRFPAEVKHVGDVTEITDKMLAEWGPFDLVIGGSPCNDLSIVNTTRKGIWSDKGSGKLFFEFVRILHSCQLLSASCNKPLFWLFENVVYMDRSSKQTISHFLQKSPVVLDAKYVSPAHRPRCFWGNLPGMNRPMVASGHHRLNLQECLEPGRCAQTQKLRTITANLNSVSKRCVISGGNKEVSVLNSAVVLHPGNQLDTLWITEIERVFGFPDHYTDVRNMARAARLRVLGKAWSVPVIKHLFAPLKDFFSCSD
uniref:DNA (cytosine-5-)-methyltransferase n=1 Tax=Phallusia mammillata TaxID=59560 RepID=A0A6F9DAN7_9ASCI|nr:DNA (cytosine-5)-methyltransferase 3A-like [Phallusia mammillata]